MAELTRPRSLLHTIIAGAAERLAMHPAIPEDSRTAFRATAVQIFEQQIVAVIGCDTLRVTGWAIPPSQRLDRHHRIRQALRDGESASDIAARELVSPRRVRQLGAEMAAENLPPENFRRAAEK